MSKKVQISLITCSILILAFSVIGGLGVHAASNHNDGAYNHIKVFKQKKTDGKANIGATISKRFGYAAIVSVIPGGPADKAGISSGDIIETIDGKSSHDMSLAEIKSVAAGEKGSVLECSIIRTRKIEPQKVSITRDVVNVPAPTEQMMADNVGYIKSVVLDKGRAQDIAEKIKSLQK